MKYLGKITDNKDLVTKEYVDSNALPSQSGQSGKFLTTDGTDASWGTIDLSSKEDVANKVTSFQATPDDTHYPSEKLVKDNLDTKAPAYQYSDTDLTAGTSPLATGTLYFVYE